VKETQDYQETAIKNATHILLSKYPEAVGVVYWILDCGCIKMCCVSEKGDPIGGTLLTSGQSVPGQDTIFVCHKCMVDRGPSSERIVDQGIAWVRPLGKEHRKLISAKVFGPRSEVIGQAII